MIIAPTLHLLPSKGLLGDDSFAELDKIEVPTFVAWGDRDSIIPRSDQEALVSAIEGSQLVVHSGLAHSLYWENPERCASDLVAFIETIIK